MLPYLSRYMGHATFDVHLLLHPHLARLHGRLRRHHRREPVAAAGGRIRMKRDPSNRRPGLLQLRPGLPAHLPAHGPRRCRRRRSRPTGSAWNASSTTSPSTSTSNAPHVSFDHFDRQHLKAWLAWMTDQRHYAPKTVALRLSAVKAFLAYCSHEDITLVALSQAAKALKAPASPASPIDYLTEAETRAVLAAFTGTHREVPPEPDAAHPALRHRRTRRRDHRPDPAGPLPDRARARHPHRQGQQDPRRAADRQDDRAPARLPRRVPPGHRHAARDPAAVLQPAPRATRPSCRPTPSPPC